MKFLLPELYVQLNAADEQAADAAEAAIERAGERARAHWRRIRSYLPAAVIRFSEDQMLHDADVLGPARLGKSGSQLSDGDLLMIAQQSGSLNADYSNTQILLHYATTAEPRVEIPIASKVFRPERPHWIWDEFDREEPGVFTHSILLSDGRVVTISFSDFQYHLAQLIAPDIIKTSGVIHSKKAASA